MKTRLVRYKNEIFTEYLEYDIIINAVLFRLESEQKTKTYG